ncbi:hypothetical protein AKO1_006691 [Acrasis kona]|uniref:ATP-dependent RNA helicase n=1 Tax=Acrasis kona TaxID=1008807 RepID=A0AAW2ZL19_9EUKA
MGLEKLTKIQESSLKPFLTGGDLLMKSETGSGKTLAYVIPLVQLLYNHAKTAQVSREHGTLAIILAPTRELCIQIQKVVQRVCIPFPWMVEGTIMGGEKKKAEKSRLRKGVTILISTPGRLEDHLFNTQSFRYDLIRHVILDEADRLLDLGFDKTIRNIMQHLRSKASTYPQTVLISATLHRKIQQLATSIDVNKPTYVGFTQDGVTIEERTMDLKKEQMPSGDIFSVPKNLKQHYVEAPSKLRLAMLAGFLRWKSEERYENDAKLKMVVFLSCCDSVEFHHTLFTTVTIHRRPMFNVPVFKLHGNIAQKDRTKTYFDFCSANSGILLCTDVASRGLDLPAVNWIVQYDPPGEPKEYLHRIGRTARLGTKGDAIIFLQPHEMLYTELLSKYDLTLNHVKGEALLEHLIVQFQDKKITDPIEAGTWLQNIFEAEVSKSVDLTKQSIAAYQSHVRYYSTHNKNVKYIFHVKNLHLGHLARSFGLKDRPTKARQTQDTLGGTNYAVERQKRIEEYNKRKTDTRVVDAVTDNQSFQKQLDEYDQSEKEAILDEEIKNIDEDDEDDEESSKPVDQDDQGYESFDEVDESQILREVSAAPKVNMMGGVSRKKLNPNERMKLYKEFSKGKLINNRPKIVIPDGLFKKGSSKKEQSQPAPIVAPEQEKKGKKRSADDVRGQGSGFVKGDGMVGDWNKLLRNPFQYKNSARGGSNGYAKMMLSTTSEFDSGLEPLNKKRK